ISVKQSRITYMAFEVMAPPGQDCGWLFTDPAFRLKDGTSDADCKRFSNMFTCCGQKVVRVTYTPDVDSAGKEYNYELRLEANVWDSNHAPSGHVIIIVDPIIGNEEV